MEAKSQNDKIYDYYQSGGHLTTLDALRLFGTMNLRSRNSDIEKQYNIRLGRIWVKDENTGKRYLKYFLIRQEKQLEIFSTNLKQ
jgi:hypothetical protein